MQFKPKTEKELRADSLAPAGEYPFDVLAAEDKTSKNGNQMIALKVGIYVGDKIRSHVPDYLLESMAAKLRHFCDTTGLLAKYEAGTLCAADCVGRSGTAKVAIEDKDPAYPAKNVIKDYVPRKAKALAPKPDKQEDDDLPPF